MMSVAEIQGWLATLPPDAQVGVDDGGLCLRVFGDEEIYCEVGGLPEPEGCNHQHHTGYGAPYQCELSSGHTGRHQQGGCSWERQFAHEEAARP